jgi:hypothetical protein
MDASLFILYHVIRSSAYLEALNLLVTEERYWALFHMPLYTYLHCLLKVPVKIANKMGLQKINKKNRLELHTNSNYTGMGGTKTKLWQPGPKNRNNILGLWVFPTNFLKRLQTFLFSVNATTLTDNRGHKGNAGAKNMKSDSVPRNKTSLHDLQGLCSG